MIGGIKEFFYRLWLLVGGFFDDNVECSWKVKWQIAKWMSGVHRFKEVSIDKFSKLLSKYGDISFPIRVFENSDLSVRIVSKNQTHYLEYFPYENTYTIWRRNYPLCEDFTFEIINGSKIILTEKGVLKMKKDGTNDNEMGDYSFSYDYQKNMTTVTLKQKKEAIKIVYTLQDEEFDKKILDYLFTIAKPKRIWHDVLPILININDIRKVDNLSIQSMRDSKELSEIVVLDGLVKKYSFSDLKETSEVLYTTRYEKPMSVDVFIAKHR